MTTSDPTLDAALRAHCDAPDHQDGFAARLESGMRRIDREPAVAGRRPWPRLGSAHGSRRLLAVAAVAAAAVVTLAVVQGIEAVRGPQSPPGSAAAASPDASPDATPTSRPSASGESDLRSLTFARVATNVRMALSGIRTLQADSTQYFKMVKGPPKAEWEDDWTTADWWARARIYSDEEFESLGTENASPYNPTQRLVVSADGRWRIEVPQDGHGGRFVDWYIGDYTTGRTVYCTADSGTVSHAEIATGAALGEPEDSGWFDTYDYHIRFMQPAAIEAMDDGSVRESTYDGRPALVVSCPVEPIPIHGLDMDSHYYDTVEFTVDRETWLIVRRSLLLRGQVVLDDSLANVRVNEPLSDAQLYPPVLEGFEDGGKDRGFGRIAFDDAGDHFATRPLGPRALPEGFRPFVAAVAAKAEFWRYDYKPGEHEHYWGPSREITHLAYRAGLLQVVVTTRSEPASDKPFPADPLEADPFVSGPVTEEWSGGGSVEAVELTGGSFEGAVAYLVMPLMERPHLWVWRDGVMVTMTGDLTRDQMLDAANSLEPLE